MSWMERLRSTLFPRRTDEGLDEELAFHLARRAEELAAAGMPAEEARREAARRFGNRTWLREEARRRDTLEWLAVAVQDVRLAARALAKSPGFAVVSVMTLGLGIGAITAIFTVVNGVLLRAMRYRDPQRVVTVWETNPAFPKGVRFSPGNFLDLREHNRSFAEIGGVAFDKFNLTGRGSAERVAAGLVSASVFPLLGVRPAIGRGFTAEDDRWTAQPVAILSDSLWRQRYGGDAGAIGQTVRLDGQECTIIGVMPAGVPELPSTYEAADGVDLWLPLERTRDPETMHWRFSYYVSVMARLAPGVSAPQAQQDVDRLIKGIVSRWPDNLGKGAMVVAVQERTVGGVRRPLAVLFAAVTFVLLIACANVANMNLGRAASRRREIALRLALGAGRWRVMRQLAAESLVLAVCGVALGLTLAAWGVSALVKLAPAELPRAGDVYVDGWVLGFTLAASVAAGLVFGIVPAWSAARGDVQNGLREAGRGSAGGMRGTRTRNALVVSEIALALVLLVGAGLMIESLRKVRAVDPGFRPEGLVTMRVPLSDNKYDSIASQAGFYGRLLDEVRRIPGLASVGAVDGLPFSDGGFDNMFTIDGRVSLPGHGLQADIRRVDAGYFRTMGIPVIQGRALEQADRIDTPDVAVISRGMAEHYWPGESAIGKRLGVMYGRPNPHPTIVGVVGDVHQALDGLASDTIYLPYPQGRVVADLYLVVRPSGHAGAAVVAAIAARVREGVRGIDDEQPVYRVRTMDELVSRSLATRRFEMLLLAIFAGVAAALAAVGLYGVLGYSVAVRTREIGIRAAMGADPGRILQMVLGDACRLAGLGMLLGAAGALALTRSMAAMLFEVRPWEPSAYLAVCLAMWAIAMAAAWIPARRAVRVEPTAALRSE
jgi:putative ABC transport system permease protein